MASEDHLNIYSSIQIETIVVLSDAEIDIHTADYPPVKSSAIQTRKVNTLGEKVMTKESENMTKESDRTSEQHTHSKIIWLFQLTLSNNATVASAPAQGKNIVQIHRTEKKFNKFRERNGLIRVENRELDYDWEMCGEKMFDDVSIEIDRCVDWIWSTSIIIIIIDNEPKKRKK